MWSRRRAVQVGFSAASPATPAGRSDPRVRHVAVVEPVFPGRRVSAGSHGPPTSWISWARPSTPTRPRVAVTYAEAGGWGRGPGALEARRRNVATVGLQHGFIFYRHWMNYHPRRRRGRRIARQPDDRGFPGADADAALRSPGRPAPGRSRPFQRRRPGASPAVPSWTNWRPRASGLVAARTSSGCGGGAACPPGGGWCSWLPSTPRSPGLFPRIWSRPCRRAGPARGGEMPPR